MPVSRLAISIPRNELDLDLTLSSGQVFRWRRADTGEWHGAIGKSPVCLVSTKHGIEVRTAGRGVTEEDIRCFLRLDVSLSQVQADLESRDARLSQLFSRTPGLRILRQEPVECLLSFVCAVATSIVRIEWSLEEIARRFGQPIGPEDCAFPGLATLADVDPEQLRLGGMEFRCRSLSRAARGLRALGGGAFLQSLKQMPYEEAFRALLGIPHVGPKVADCVLLFSLGFDAAFPLDTHTRRTAAMWYGLDARASAGAAYTSASAVLRSTLGPYAGWAQQYLYCASRSGAPAPPPDAG